MEHTYTIQTGIKKGIKYINDLIKEDGEVYTLEEFIETTGVQTNHLQYYGTLRAIKLYLKHVKVKINTKPYPSTLKAKKGFTSYVSYP